MEPGLAFAYVFITRRSKLAQSLFKPKSTHRNSEQPVPNPGRDNRPIINQWLFLSSKDLCIFPVCIFKSVGFMEFPIIRSKHVKRSSWQLINLNLLPSRLIWPYQDICEVVSNPTIFHCQANAPYCYLSKI